MRYTGYRHYVRWIYGYLGKDVRIPLPSCVVKAIKDKFPSNIDQHVGFKYPQLKWIVYWYDVAMAS